MDIPQQAYNTWDWEMGKVYYFKNTKRTFLSEIPHYHFLFHIENSGNKIYFFFVITSNEKAAEKNNPLPSVVFLNPEDYSPLEKSSYLTCSNFFPFTQEEIIAIRQNAENSKYDHSKTFSLKDSDIENVRIAIEKSKTLSTFNKKTFLESLKNKLAL